MEEINMNLVRALAGKHYKVEGTANIQVHFDRIVCARNEDEARELTAEEFSLGDVYEWELKNIDYNYIERED